LLLVSPDFVASVLLKHRARNSYVTASARSSYQ
jgi:hypothetical protein